MVREPAPLPGDELRTSRAAGRRRRGAGRRAFRIIRRPARAGATARASTHGYIRPSGAPMSSRCSGSPSRTDSSQLPQTPSRQPDGTGFPAWFSASSRDSSAAPGGSARSGRTRPRTACPARRRAGLAGSVRCARAGTALRPRPPWTPGRSSRPPPTGTPPPGPRGPGGRRPWEQPYAVAVLGQQLRSERHGRRDRPVYTSVAGAGRDGRPQHRHDRRDPDPAGQEQVLRCRCQREVVAGQGDFERAARAQVQVDVLRAAAAERVVADGDPVGGEHPGRRTASTAGSASSAARGRGARPAPTAPRALRRLAAPGKGRRRRRARCGPGSSSAWSVQLPVACFEDMASNIAGSDGDAQLVGDDLTGRRQFPRQRLARGVPQPRPQQCPAAVQVQLGDLDDDREDRRLRLGPHPGEHVLARR